LRAISPITGSANCSPLFALIIIMMSTARPTTITAHMTTVTRRVTIPRPAK